MGAHLYDDTGRRYLDTVNNVAHVGHGNRCVARAIARQSRVLNTNTRYLHGEIVALADDLLAHFPAPLEVVFPVCSGSEANELALRMARCHTGRERRGLPGGRLPRQHRRAGRGESLQVRRVPAGRGRPTGWPRRRCRTPTGGVTGGPMGSRTKRWRPATRTMSRVAPGCSGTGGTVSPPSSRSPSWAAADRSSRRPATWRPPSSHIRAAGGVCIADEVQVGFGRVGDAFWGFELQAAVPDIVTLGKPMGNGHPVAAVVTTRAIAESFANGMEYFSTFGGNPVSCAAARAVLAEIRERGLMEHARRAGGGAARGVGGAGRAAWAGGGCAGAGAVPGSRDRARPRDTGAVSGGVHLHPVERARGMGVLLSVDGPGHNVLKVKPPMVFDEDDAVLLVETLDEILGESALCRPMAARVTRTDNCALHIVKKRLHRGVGLTGRAVGRVERKRVATGGRRCSPSP